MQASNKEIRKILINYSEDKYKHFSQTLTPGAKNIIGVRVPQVKQLAKDLVKKNLTYTAGDPKNAFFEEVLLEGFVIAYKKNTLETFVKEVKDFIPKINNWAHCDLFCCALKRVNKERTYFFDFIKPYLKSKEEFKVRFALVFLLAYYVRKEYLPFLFDTLDNFKHQGYYAKMAAAWLLSVCFVKFPDETFTYAKKSKLDRWTFKKGLEKTKQSFRISKEFKETLNTLL